MCYRKRITALVLVLVFPVLVFAGCGQTRQGQEQTNGRAANSLELKVAHQWPEQSDKAQTIKFFTDRITELTGGEITFKIFPANSLVNIQEMLDAVTDGVADIGFTTSSFTAPKIKELAVLEIPGAFDPAKVGEVAEAIDPLLQQIFEHYGVVYLFAFDDGEAALALDKVVHTPADLERVQIRTPGQWVSKAFEAWGAVPATIPPAELNVALERGTVDGAYGSWNFCRSYKVHEQKKAVTFTGLQTMWAFLIMNKASWERLTPEQQQIFAEVGREAMEHNIRLDSELEPKYKEEVRASGGEVYELTPAERAAFIEKTKPVFEEARQIIGPLGNQLLDRLEALR